MLIVLPCWWIFFDKAHSISRNTGYIQILEEILIDNNKGNYYYYGFENALRILRNEKNEDYIIKFIKEEESQADDDKKIIKSKNSSVFNFGNHRFRYWVLNWVVFTILSFLCCITSIFYFLLHYNYCSFNILLFLSQLLLLFIPLYIVIRISSNTHKIIKSLIHGKYSYKNYYKIWQKVLVDNELSGIKLPEKIIRIKPIISNTESKN